jgi:LysM repeat protein
MYKKNNSISTLSIPGKNYLEKTPADSLTSINTVTVNADSDTIPEDPAPRKNVPVRVQKTYVVKSGDSLSKIADKFNVPLTKLKSHNGLRNDLIRPGQKLKIP